MGCFHYAFANLIRIVALIWAAVLMFIAGGHPVFSFSKLDRHFSGPITVSEVIESVRKSINRIKPFSVDFVQQVYTDEQVDIEESGNIIFKNDRLLKWVYLDPEYKAFLLENDDYQFYDEDNEQLIIGKIKDRSQLWIWQLVFSEDTLQYYHVTWDKSQKSIYFKSNPDTNIDETRDTIVDIEIIINDDNLPIEVIQKDPSGAHIVYKFREYKSKIKITDDTFRLDVPDNVEIIKE